MRDIEVMRKLAELGEAFTAEEAREKLGLDRGAFYYHVRNLEREGMIERIGRGRYRIVFPKGGAMDRFLLSSLMVPESAVGYWTALNYYGFTEQMPNTTYVLTPVRGNYRALRNLGLKVVIVHPRKFFGFRELRVSGRKVRITDPEKTVADCLDRPGNCGGIGEVVKALREGVSVERVAENLRRMGSYAGLKRLGYLSEALGRDVPEIEEMIRKARGYTLLDPLLGREGRWNGRWKVVVNIPDDYLEA